MLLASLVGRHDRIIGMDLFDSPKTLKTLWDRLSDAYFFDALRDPKAAPATSIDHAQRFIERLGSAAKPRVPALALGDELEITSEGIGWGGSALRWRHLPPGCIQ